MLQKDYQLIITAYVSILIILSSTRASPRRLAKKSTAHPLASPNPREQGALPTNRPNSSSSDSNNLLTAQTEVRRDAPQVAAEHQEVEGAGGLEARVVTTTTEE